MRAFILLCLSLLTFSLNAQILTPVKWSTAYEQVTDDEFNLIFTATIDDGWVIYSQYLESEDGPIPTGFYFDEGDHYELIGKNEESGNRKEAYDKVFDMQLIKFYKKAIFTQKVKIKDLSKPIAGYLEFMTCDDERCLPPTEEEFSFTLKSIPSDASGAVEPATETATEGTAAITSPDAQEAAATETQATSADQQSDQIGISMGNILDPVTWNLKVMPAEAKQI